MYSQYFNKNSLNCHVSHYICFYQRDCVFVLYTIQDNCTRNKDIALEMFPRWSINKRGDVQLLVGLGSELVLSVTEKTLLQGKRTK